MICSHRGDQGPGRVLPLSRQAASCRKPRHNFVYLSADVSRPYRFIVTPQICISELFPSGSLIPALCGVVAGLAGLDSTRSS
jgi:hypothetical protein